MFRFCVERLLNRHESRILNPGSVKILDKVSDQKRIINAIHTGNFTNTGKSNAGYSAQFVCKQTHHRRNRRLNDSGMDDRFL